MARRRSIALGAVLALAAPIAAMAQIGGQSSGSTASQGGGAQASGPATVKAAQDALGSLQQSNAAGSAYGSGASGQVSQTDFRGSLVEGKATGDVLPLTLDDAIARGLRTNLGIILQSSAVQSAGGTRLQQLQALLPTVTANVSYTVEQVDLAAYGLKFPGIRPIVGPFQVEDARVYLSQSVVNVSSIERYLAAKHNFEGATLSAEDARNLVVLTVGNAYLLCLADQARIAAENAERATAKVSLDQATASHEAGTSPRLDVLRAQVDYQNADQLLIQARNSLEKDKLALARAIGLPLEQRFSLADQVPYAPADAVTPQQAFDLALAQRKDLAAAKERLKGAESERKAAWAEQLPAADLNGNFGDLGTTFAHSHSTYTAVGEASMPVLQIARTRGDIEVADAALQQDKARLSDQVQQINQDVQDAILDIEAAQKLVEAARSNVNLANEALSEAQQRFKAGVTDNLEVSEAQSQTEQANEQYISALYQHNLAKLSLARATGTAGTQYKQALQLGGK